MSTALLIILLFTVIVISLGSYKYLFLKSDFIGAAKEYSDRISKFALSNYLYFSKPQIDIFRTVISSIANHDRYNHIVYRHSKDIDNKLRELNKENIPFFPILVKHFYLYFSDKYIFNFQKGKYKNNNIQIYNCQLNTTSRDYQTVNEKYSYNTNCEIAIKASEKYLFIKPESSIEKIINIIGEQDIEVEFQNFNRKYKVQSNDPKFVFGVLDPLLIEELMGFEDLSIIIYRGRVIVSQLGLQEANKIENNLNLAIKIADNMKVFR